MAIINAFFMNYLPESLLEIVAPFSPPHRGALNLAVGFNHLSLPKLFIFAPEAQRILAGGASHRKARHYCFAPRQGRGTLVRS